MSDNQEIVQQKNQDSLSADAWLELRKDAEDIYASMSVEERVGQLFILAFPGKDPKVIFEIIDQYGLGGCYISQDNAETSEEARNLTSALQNRMNMRWKERELPLILGVDQEGAWGVLIPESTIGPGNLALGVSDDVHHTKTMYRIFAQEMGAAGYQAILGPCSDVNLDPQNPIIGTRSFGENAPRVARHVAAAVRAIRSQGLLAAAKHFPGHGDTHSDTHRDIPVVDKSMEVLLQQELLPFQAAIDAGVDMVMTSHILFPQIDTQFPATLSKPILTDLLRGTMNFKGLIITDSMNMGAMRKHYSPAEATVMAFMAGADLIMLSEEHYDHSAEYLEKQLASIQGLISHLHAGQISEEILKDRVLRVLQKKLEMARTRSAPFTTPSERVLFENGKPQRDQAAFEAAKHAVRVLRDTKQLLPLSRESRLAIVNATPRSSYASLMNARGIGPNQSTPAFDSFIEVFKRSWSRELSVLTYEDLYEKIDSMLKGYDRIIAVTEDYPLPGEDFAKKEQQEMIQSLIAQYNDCLIVLGLRSPYELELYSGLHCYVSTYSSRTCSAVLAAQLLCSGELGSTA